MLTALPGHSFLHQHAPAPARAQPDPEARALAHRRALVALEVAAKVRPAGQLRRESFAPAVRRRLLAEPPLPPGRVELVSIHCRPAAGGGFEFFGSARCAARTLAYAGLLTGGLVRDFDVVT